MRVCLVTRLSFGLIFLTAKQRRASRGDNALSSAISFFRSWLQRYRRVLIARFTLHYTDKGDAFGRSCACFLPLSSNWEWLRLGHDALARWLCCLHANQKISLCGWCYSYCIRACVCLCVCHLKWAHVHVCCGGGIAEHFGRQPLARERETEDASAGSDFHLHSLVWQSGCLLRFPKWQNED